LLDELRKINSSKVKVILIPECHEDVTDAEIKLYLRENEFDFTTLERAHLNSLESHPILSRINIMNFKDSSTVLVNKNGEIVKSYDKNAEHSKILKDISKF
jgi:hypothetical protein